MDPEPGGPKTYGSDGSGFGSGSATLLGTQVCGAARYGHPGLHLLRPLLHAGEPGKDRHTHRLTDPVLRDKKR
jgi:hypothetical protein